jgi:hypothetical protein
MRIKDRIRSKFTDATGSDPDDGLIEAVLQAMRACMAVDFNPDPLFAPEFSRVVSTAASVVKRHGPLIENAIAAEFERAGLEVKREPLIPITRAAMAVVDSSDYERLAKEQYAFDENDIVEWLKVDMIVIDEPGKRATAVEVKRGGGLTASRNRKASERPLRALELTLASRLRQEGHRNVEAGYVCVVDYLGQSGFSQDMALHGAEIDEHFGLPIVAAIDRMTASLKDAFDIEVRRLLEPVLRTLAAEPAPAKAFDDTNGIRAKGRGSRSVATRMTGNFKPFPDFAVRNRQ